MVFTSRTTVDLRIISINGVWLKIINGKSDVYSRNNNGPSTEPWGTGLVMCRAAASESSDLTENDMLVKKASIMGKLQGKTNFTWIVNSIINQNKIIKSHTYISLSLQFFLIFHWKTKFRKNKSLNTKLKLVFIYLTSPKNLYILNSEKSWLHNVKTFY